MICWTIDLRLWGGNTHLCHFFFVSTFQKLPKCKFQINCPESSQCERASTWGAWTCPRGRVRCCCWEEFRVIDSGLPQKSNQPAELCQLRVDQAKATCCICTHIKITQHIDPGSDDACRPHNNREYALYFFLLVFFHWCEWVHDPSPNLSHMKVWVTTVRY